MNGIIDTHAHYDDAQFDEDREALLSGLPDEKISLVVNVSASLDSSVRTVELTKGYANVYGAVGVHPDAAAELDEDGFARLRKLACLPKIVAVGEIGLDYYWDASEREVQKKWFIRQMVLAQELKLPFIVHSREAAEDTLRLVRQVDNGRTGGVIHCFSYSREMAAEYLKMGYYLGIGGVVTFKNARKLKEVVEEAPLDRLVLETDSPYLAPVPFRGKRNTSWNLPLVAEEIGRIRGLSEEEVVRITAENALRLYGLDALEEEKNG